LNSLIIKLHVSENSLYLFLILNLKKKKKDIYSADISLLMIPTSYGIFSIAELLSYSVNHMVTFSGVGTGSANNIDFINLKKQASTFEICGGSKSVVNLCQMQYTSFDSAVLAIASLGVTQGTNATSTVLIQTASSSVFSLIKSNKIRVIAVSSYQPDPSNSSYSNFILLDYPDALTFNQQGFSINTL